MLDSTPHLGPEDIDFWVDGDEGFATHPVRKHLEACGDCRSAVARARELNRSLERLAAFAPAADFSSRVMARVQVFEPWHVSLADSVRRLVPRSGPWRVLATAGAAGAAVSVSALAIWITLRLDLAIYAAQLGWGRLREFAVAGGSAAVTSLFGEPVLDALRGGGTTTLFLGAAAFVASLGVATFGLRGLLAFARRRSR